MSISLIAAFDATKVIGYKGNIPWHLKEDLKIFSKLTKGSTVIMGRKTYESIGNPLPNRLNIVMTRNPRGLEGVEEVDNKERAIEVASKFSNKIYVIGGEDIYTEFMPIATNMYLTKININVEGDTFFPNWDEAQWEEVSRRDSKELDMPAFPREEIEETLRRWVAANDKAGETGDWAPLGNFYTEDAMYSWNIGHKYEFCARGIQAVSYTPLTQPTILLV